MELRIRVRPEDGRGDRGDRRRRQAILLGRQTYEEFAPAWSSRTASDDPGAPFFNESPKYVVSGTLQSADWSNSTVLGSYDAAAIGELKERVGNIYVSGSGTLVRALLADGLVDELHLFVFPLTLGAGKRLFDAGARSSSSTLLDTETFDQRGGPPRLRPGRGEAIQRPRRAGGSKPSARRRRPGETAGASLRELRTAQAAEAPAPPGRRSTRSPTRRRCRRSPRRRSELRRRGIAWRARPQRRRPGRRSASSPPRRVPAGLADRRPASLTGLPISTTLEPRLSNHPIQAAERASRAGVVELGHGLVHRLVGTR